MICVPETTTTNYLIGFTQLRSQETPTHMIIDYYSASGETRSRKKKSANQVMRVEGITHMSDFHNQKKKRKNKKKKKKKLYIPSSGVCQENNNKRK